MNAAITTGVAGNSSSIQASKKADNSNSGSEAELNFEDMFTPTTTVSFGEGGISMADLAKCFTPKEGGGGTFNFSGLQGVTVTHHDEK